MRFDDDGLELAVAGPAVRARRVRRERARQRVQLHRGTLDASVRDGRAEAVVWLPVVAVRDDVRGPVVARGVALAVVRGLAVFGSGTVPRAVMARRGSARCCSRPRGPRLGDCLSLVPS